jgi:hypothetical protein
VETAVFWIFPAASFDFRGETKVSMFMNIWARATSVPLLPDCEKR